MMDFATQVRDRRRQESLSQTALAERVGISRNYLSQIERGKATNLSWQVRQSLSDVLGITDVSPDNTDDLPEGLAEFAQRVNLPQDDLQMLVNLRYRGQQPTTADKWEMLYNVIKVTIAP